VSLGLGIEQALEQWSPAGVYLNTASYGLPPRDGFEALQQALADWRTGRTSWEQWGESAERARRAFGAMVGAPSEQVAIGANVSVFMGLTAASLPDGARVVIPEIEFASSLFPFLVQEARGVQVTVVAPAQLAETIDERTDAVVFSAVQMSTGEVADLDAILAAAREHGTMTVLDATQACGWLPLCASRFDAVVCSAYKWLMSPREQRLRTSTRTASTRSSPTQRAGTPGRTSTQATSARRCASRMTRAGSTSPPPGFRGWARPRRSSSSTESASTPYTAMMWRSPTASGPASGSSPATARSCRPTSPAPRSASSAPASSPRCAAAGCAPPGTSTTPRRTSTAHWKLSRIDPSRASERGPAKTGHPQGSLMSEWVR